MIKRLGVILLAFGLLAGCADAVAPPTASATYGTEQAEVLGIYGAGGVDLSANLGPGQGTLLGDQLPKKFGARIRVVGYWNWDDYSINDYINAIPLSKMVIIIGDSCGASIGPFDAAAVHRPVTAVIGVQASYWCPTVGSTDPVPSNVAYAEETYNPNCLETGWLGCRVYTASKSTKLTLVQRYDYHPDLQQDFFNDALDEVSLVLSSSGALNRSGGTQVLIRHHGQHMRFQ